MNKRISFLLAVLVSFFCLVQGTGSAQMAQTRLWSIFPSGCQAGKETGIQLFGADIGGVRAILFTHPGIKAEAKLKDASPYAEFLGEKPGIETGRFTVRAGADVPPGIYEARAVGTHGVSNPRCFVVSSSEEVAEQQGKNNTFATAMEVPADCSVSGVVQGNSMRDFYRLQAVGGSRVVVDCLASRIDSQLLPVLTLYNSGGKEIGSSRIDKRKDALLDFSVAEDGPVTIEVRDIRYKGSNDYFYRLKISAGPHVDTIFPPVGVPGTEQEFLILGRNLPEGQPAPEFSFNGTVPDKLLRKIQVPAYSARGGGIIESRDFGGRRFPQALQKDLGSSEGAYLWLASYPVITETEPNNAPGKATTIKVPCEVAGRFYPRGDRDLFEFVAEEDGLIKVEVRSQRLGLGTDPAFEIQQVSTDKDGKESVKEIKFQDDGLPNVGGGHFGTVSDDPLGEFGAKKGVRYRIRVRDLYSDSNADPRNVYSLVLRKPRPDFEVILLPGYPEAETDNKKNKPAVWGSLLRRNGTARFIAYTYRKDGFSGSIDLSFEGLPGSVKGAKGRIFEGKSSTTLVLHAAADAAEWGGAFKVFATARLAGKDVRKEVSYGTLLWSGLSKARLTGGMGIAVSGAESSPFKIEPSTASYDMARGGSLDLTLKVPREGWAQGKITVNALNLPGDVELKQFIVNDKKNEAKAKITIKPKAPLGDHVFYLRGNAEVQYSRNPGAVAGAKKRHEKMGGILKAITAEVAAKNKSLAESKATFAKAQEAVKKSAGESADARKADEEAARNLDAMAKKAKAAAEAVQNNPADTNLVTAKAEADKAHQAAEQKNKDLSGKVPAAEKKHAEAMAASKATEEASKKLEEETKASKEKEGRAKKALDAAKKEADGLANAAKPKKTKVGIYSFPINLKITDAAFAFDGKLGPDGGFKVKAGTSGELPVKIQRLYGFKEQVKIKAVTGKAGGVKIAEIQVPKDKGESMFKVEVAKNAPVGKYEIQVEASAKFGSANQAVKSSFQLVIEAPDEPEKKDDKPE